MWLWARFAVDVLTVLILTPVFFPWGGLAIVGVVLSALALRRRHRAGRAGADGLTGLAGRARFREVSGGLLARGHRTAILSVDVNDFHKINEAFGHRAGDRVLIEFAGVLSTCVPRQALAARVGDDEFAVVLTGIDTPEQAYEVAGRLAAALGPVLIDGRLVPLGAGIGVAVSGPGELTLDELTHRAGLAMRKAKSLGPDTRWAIWQHPPDETALPTAA